MTNIQKVLELIRNNPDGLDDDEISNMTSITPRQQVYQICSRLDSLGHIRRETIEKPGKRKKIHNFPIDEDNQNSRPPGHSSKWEQRLSALVAATGRGEDELLDEALKNLAFRVLKAQDGD